MSSKRLLFPLIAVLSSSSVFGGKLVDFETESPGDKPLGWTFSGDSSNVMIEATTPSGGYPGGQALRTDPSGASFGGLRYAGPTIVSLQADFLWDWSADGTPTLAVYAWDDDDSDGFQSAERTVGFGIDNDGQFELSNENGELTGSTDFSPDTWYRLTLTWTDPDEFGNRLVTLSALDLTNETNLGVLESVSMTPEEFGVAPEEWDGIAFRMTRGTLDNLTITGEPGPAFTYIDASPTNTTLNSDPENSPEGVPLEAGVNYVNDGSAGSGSDGLWTFRTDESFVTFEGSNAFETDNASTADDAEVTPDLITTVELPLIGTYDLVAVFSRKNNRDIAARLGSAPEAGDIFDGIRNLNADQEADFSEIRFNDSFTNSRGNNSGVAYLGKVTTTSDNESVRVFINGLASTVDADGERTQYDGIGFRISSGAVNPLTLSDLTYNATDGASEIKISGAPGARYILVEADDLDFENPTQNPVILGSVTIGTQSGNEVITDANGDATIQFALTPGKTASFIRALRLP